MLWDLMRQPGRQLMPSQLAPFMSVGSGAGHSVGTGPIMSVGGGPGISIGMGPSIGGGPESMAGYLLQLLRQQGSR